MQLGFLNKNSTDGLRTVLPVIRKFIRLSSIILVYRVTNQIVIY